jgi:hypothetical protein
VRPHLPTIPSIEIARRPRETVDRSAPMKRRGKQKADSKDSKRRYARSQRTILEFGDEYI